jgi:hypothetical protein
MLRVGKVIILHRRNTTSCPNPIVLQNIFQKRNIHNKNFQQVKKASSLSEDQKEAKNNKGVRNINAVPLSSCRSSFNSSKQSRNIW